MYPLAGRRSALRCVTGSNISVSSSSGSLARASQGSCSPSRFLHHAANHPLLRPHRQLRRLTPPEPQSQPKPNQSHRYRHQYRALKTSSTSCSPSPPSSSPPSTKNPPPSYSAPVDSRSLLPQFFSGRSRRLRYTHLPAIVMGAANQTRDSAGDHGPNGSGSHSHDHGHSHSHGLGGHHHHHDTTYLVSKNRNNPGVRITNIGLASNLAMAVAKFAGGWAFNSKSMIADAWHSMTDLASDVLTLATVSWSLKPPTDRFPLGFGKVESLGALGVSGMLLVGGCYMGWDSAITLYGFYNPEAAHSLLEHVGHGHSHSHGAAALGIPGIHAAWIAGGTIVIKEWLYHATMKVARERHSSVLASNAIHHRVDSLTGIVTLVAIVGANVIENAAWLDPVGGLLISIMVIHAGAGNMVDAFCELADQSIDEDVKKAVSKQARKAIGQIDASHQVELRDVSGVKSGQNYLMDLEMSVPGNWSVEHVREMEAAIRKRVGDKVRGVKRVRARFVSQDEPVNHKFDEFIADKTTELDEPEPKQEEDSDSDSNGNGNGNKRNGHDHNGKHRH